MSCLANERGRRCPKLPSANSKWCVKHEELQAKSLKSYKRVSYELEGFDIPHITASDIAACGIPSALEGWAQLYRRKWVLTKRTVEARQKHHASFYSGGDTSHQAFINNLTSAQNKLEALLFALDDRAYALYVKQEQAEWLDAPLVTGPVCNEEPAAVPIKVALQPQVLADSISSLELCSSDSSDDSGSLDGYNSDGATDIDTASSVSCTSNCCQPVMQQQLTSRRRLQAYLNYSCLFSDPEDKHLVDNTIHNIFRLVISRTPRLLVRIRSLNAKSVSEAVELLEEDDCARLWRALKYANANSEGKVNVDVIRNALCTAEQTDGHCEHAFIDILGGRVYKSPRVAELSWRGWDMMYRFTSCSGCALSVTRTLSAWARNRMLANTQGPYTAWAERDETPNERALRQCGALLCGGFKRAKMGALEHVKPKTRGMKSVWIERDSRNWCFMRFTEDNPRVISLLKSQDVNLRMLSWPQSSGDVSESEKPIWMSRLRSGHTPMQRKSAKWTCETSFTYTECTHKRLLSSSPEVGFRSGVPFTDSIDILCIDIGTTQDYDVFIKKIITLLETVKDDGAVEMRDLHDKAYIVARQMFKEE